MPKEPILIASDLSARTDRAVERGMMLGKQLARPVALVHVRGKGRADEEGRKEAERFARASLPDPSADIELILPTGAVAEEIDKVGDERDAAMIVCGVARFNDFWDYITGTAVDSIISKTRRPVLVVKRKAREDYRKLLVAVDFSDHSAHALAVAAALFPAAEITLIHAYQVAYEGLQKGEHLPEEARRTRQASLDKFLQRPELDGLKSRVQTKLVYGDVGEALIEGAKEVEPDLVVAGTHGSGALRRATIGSIASEMLQWMPHDMMVIPPVE